MTNSNKEWIENLEANVEEIKEEIQKMNVDVANKFKSIEEALHRLTESVVVGRDGSDASATRSTVRSTVQEQQLQATRTDGAKPLTTVRPVKLEFPKFKEGDPTAGIGKSKQYFGYHSIPAEQQVTYHLEKEATEWWQATSKALEEEGKLITWQVFEAELWVRFGPTDGDDFDEALSKIQQTGTLHEYQREFERLQNKVEGWTQKALIGTYVGGLNPIIADSVRMFRPKTLKEVLNLARLKDEQMHKRKKKLSNGSSYGSGSYESINKSSQPKETEPPSIDATTQAPRKLSWEELKKKRSLGLCFSCDEKYLPGHKCKQPKLFIMEGEYDESGSDSGEEKEGTEADRGGFPKVRHKP